MERILRLHHRPYLMFCYALLVIQIYLSGMVDARRVRSMKFYNALGLSASASKRDIKKAFRLLSKKYHPDKNPTQAAKDKMMLINNAHETLMDDKKRRLYDQYGEDYKKHQHGGMNPFDPFSSFFGGGGHQDEDDADKRGPDVHMDIYASLSELYSGRVYEADKLKLTACSHCFGSGAETEDDMVTCRKCGGSGTVIERRTIGPGFVQQMQNTCPKCGGKGKIIRNHCHVCGGSGLEHGTRTLYFDLQKGSPDGFEVTFDNEADEHKDIQAGHIIFKVVTVDDPRSRFRRDKDDLHYTARISLLQALVGYEFEIVHLDGHKVKVTSSGVTQPTDVKKIAEEGMPKFGTFPTEYGDLFVHFVIVFPGSLTEEQKKEFRQLGFK